MIRLGPVELPDPEEVRTSLHEKFDEASTLLRLVFNKLTVDQMYTLKGFHQVNLNRVWPLILFGHEERLARFFEGQALGFVEGNPGEWSVAIFLRILS